MKELTAQERKDRPMFQGLLKYFPDALMEVSRVSKIGNDQHNPGQPIHWAKEKSTDHEDCIVRHLTDEARGVPVDTDGVQHLAKVAWRALAALQIRIESQRLASTGCSDEVPPLLVTIPQRGGAELPKADTVRVAIHAVVPVGPCPFCHKRDVYRHPDTKLWLNYGTDQPHTCGRE